MNTKNLLIATAAGGLTSIVLANVPVLNLVNCLLCLGFWGGPLLAVWLYKRLGGTFTLGRAVGIGALAGVWSAVLGLLLSLVGLAGFGALLQSYARFAPPDANLDPGIASMEPLFNVIGVGVDIAFGAIGGLIGGVLWRAKPAPVTSSAAQAK